MSPILTAALAMLIDSSGWACGKFKGIRMIPITEIRADLISSTILCIISPCYSRNVLTKRKPNAAIPPLISA